MIKKHRFLLRENHNTVCGRIVNPLVLTNGNPTCKQCIGYIKKQERIAVRHFFVNEIEKPREFLFFKNLCHTIGGENTMDYSRVTCKKCIYKMRKKHTPSKYKQK